MRKVKSPAFSLKSRQSRVDWLQIHLHNVRVRLREPR
jgi:hypothetical protein